MKASELDKDMHPRVQVSTSYLISLSFSFLLFKEDNINMCHYKVDVRTKEIMYIKCLSQACVENFTKKKKMLALIKSSSLK